MNAELLQNSQRVVGHWGWRWMCGMLVSWEHKPMQPVIWDWSPRVARLVDSESGWLPIPTVRAVDQIPEGAVPVFSDAATVGCIAELARDAHGRRDIKVTYDDGKWTLGIPRTMPNGCRAWLFAGSYSTDGEAWAAALLAAPDREVTG